LHPLHRNGSKKTIPNAFSIAVRCERRTAALSLHRAQIGIIVRPILLSRLLPYLNFMGLYVFWIARKLSIALVQEYDVEPSPGESTKSGQVFVSTDVSTVQCTDKATSVTSRSFKSLSVGLPSNFNSGCRSVSRRLPPPTAGRPGWQDQWWA
jgi:hypothetical protein